MNICGDFHDSPSMFRYVNKQTKLTKFLKVQNSVKKNIWDYSFDVYCSRRVPGRITISFHEENSLFYCLFWFWKMLEKVENVFFCLSFLIFLKSTWDLPHVLFWPFPPQNWYSDKWTTCFLRHKDSGPLVDLSIPIWRNGKDSLLPILRS